MGKRGTKKSLRILVSSPVYTKTKLVKRQFHIGNIQKSILFLAGKTLHWHYNQYLAQVVWGENRHSLSQ
jgi:hypothetical protein